MRFLIIDTDYSSFLNWLYAQGPGLKHKAYEKQLQVRAESLFACGLSYSSNLRKLGHEAHHIFFNNEALQIGCLNRLLSVDRFLDSRCQSRLSSA